LVVTNIGQFFITVSLGEIKLENQSVFMISPGAPMGKLLIGKKVGDEFEMNKNLIKVSAII
jgi:transcription elongation GreA/GreB family factor